MIGVMLQTMKNLQLVNRHWSLWAMGAMAMLRITEPRVLSAELVEVMARKFSNLSSLYLYRIDDDGWQALSKLPCLTHLELTCQYYEEISDGSMGCLGKLTTLRDLCICTMA